MKYEWRKKDKQFYLPKTKPEIIDIPKMTFITIEGAGSPGSAEFQQCVEALYSISYPIKMTLKKNVQFYDYTVFPLEGIWDLDSEGAKLYNQGTPITELKHLFKYKLMIRQPDFLSDELFESFKQSVYDNKKLDNTLKLKREIIEEGQVCQMTHIGSFDDEPKSFKLMEEFTVEQGFNRQNKSHREIYISDPRRVSEDKLKTVLRFLVKKS